MRVKSIVARWEFVLLAMTVSELLFFGFLNPDFLDAGNLLYSTNDFAHILIAAIPFTLVVIAGGIDISITSTMGLSSIVFGLLWKFGGFPIGAAAGAALVLGCLAGSLNGMLAANTDINPIVLTLGTQFLFQGFAAGLSGSIGASGYNGIGGFPESFSNIAYGSFAGLPNALVFSILLAFFVSVLLNSTKTGRSIFLVGVNKPAALYSGIRVRRTIVTTYVLTGLCASIVGLYLSAYFTSSRADLGRDALMPAITAVVLGGTDINGGSGSVLGTVLAVIFLGYMKQGLMTVGVTSDVSQVMVGLILIVTVILKTVIARFSSARLNRTAFARVGRIR